MRTIVSVLLGALLSACAATPPQQDYTLINLSDDFVQVFAETQGASDADKIRAFRTDLAAQFPLFYRPRNPGEPSSEAELDLRILNAFNEFPDIRDKYLLAANDFTAMIETAIASFRKTLPDLKPFGDVYLTHSLGQMDGGTRQYEGRTYFIFGADVMARVHPPGSEEPFFHHELFHIYHQQWFPECEPIWCGLWAEGLAVLAARELNPGATDSQLLLTVPVPIREQVDANLQEAVCAVRARLESSSPDDYSALFNFKRLNDRLPPRFGYYVGLLVAEKAREHHSLQRLAHMNLTQGRKVLRESIDELADCPA